MMPDPTKATSSSSFDPVVAEGDEEFRERTRAPVVAGVRLKFDSFGNMRNGYTANVSRGGMFVAGAEFQPVGTMVKFELELAPGSPPVTGLGEVVWIRLKQRDLTQPPGMGIQFRYLNGKSRRLVREAVGKALARVEEFDRAEAPSAGVARRADRLLREVEEALSRLDLPSS